MIYKLNILNFIKMVYRGVQKRRPRGNNRDRQGGRSFKRK
jgi:hypothetical protein